MGRKVIDKDSDTDVVANKKSPEIEAFELLMKKYKEQSPEKFAQKEASGEWQRRLAAIK